MASKKYNSFHSRIWTPLKDQSWVQHHAIHTNTFDLALIYPRVIKENSPYHQQLRSALIIPCKGWHRLITKGQYILSWFEVIVLIIQYTFIWSALISQCAYRNKARLWNLSYEGLWSAVTLYIIISSESKNRSNVNAVVTSLSQISRLRLTVVLASICKTGCSTLLQRLYKLRPTCKWMQKVLRQYWSQAQISYGMLCPT